MKIKHAVFSFILFSMANTLNLASAAPLPETSVIKVQNRQLIVNNTSFTVKGVCYSPVKAGYSWTNYDWWSDPSAYNNDFPLIASMGANCIRTYNVSVNDTCVQNVLDAAAANGLYVILGYNVSWSSDFSVAANRTQVVHDFVAFVNKWKTHKAVLMWGFGNEVDAHTPNQAGWFVCVDSAAVAAHTAEGAGFHPVITANHEIDETVTYDNSVPNLDLWGLNVYRGRAFGNLFTSYISTKPFVMTEWGCDSFDSRINNENEVMQSEYVRSQWIDIEDNLSYRSASNYCIGGCVFEWCDEWWKGSSTPGNASTIGSGGLNGFSVQDTAADWTNSNYEDTNMNEEWWGLAKIALDSYERTLKKAYYTLSNAWGGTATDLSDAPSVGAGLFQGDIKNYPNPLVNDGNSSTRIRFNVNGSPEVGIEIYDLHGEKLCDVENVSSAGSTREAYWNGKDSDAGVVPAGLYICKVKASLSGREEVKYRKIAVIK